MKGKRKWKRRTCGTRAAFEKHLRRGQRPCSLCLPFVDTYSDDEIVALRQQLADKARERTLWDSHNISIATFHRILSAQNWRCACCGSRKSDEAWCVDHDHRSMKIRGIICSSCDSGLKLLGDDLVSVRRAEAYLVAHEVRGGHAKDRTAPPARSVVPKFSKRMRQCFRYLSLGVPRNKIVVLMQIEPKTVDDLEDLWIEHGRPRIEDAEHELRILQDPLRVGCDCGFEVAIAGPEEMRDAVGIVNDHVEEMTKVEDFTRLPEEQQPQPPE